MIAQAKAEWLKKTRPQAVGKDGNGELLSFLLLECFECAELFGGKGMEEKEEGVVISIGGASC